MNPPKIMGLPLLLAGAALATAWRSYFTVRLLATAGLLFLIAGVESAGAREARAPKPKASETLHFSLIDQLPTSAFNGIAERRRLGVFNAALQDVVREGKLPPAVLINKEPELRSGIGSEIPQPPGTLIVRVFLTQWAETNLGGPADTEILCRIFVEEVRDKQRVAKLGPFFSRVRFDIASGPLYEQRLATYQVAARETLEQLAAALRR